MERSLARNFQSAEKNTILEVPKETIDLVTTWMWPWRMIFCKKTWEIEPCLFINLFYLYLICQDFLLLFNVLVYVHTKSNLKTLPEVLSHRKYFRLTYVTHMLNTCWCPAFPFCRQDCPLLWITTSVAKEQEGRKHCYPFKSLNSSTHKIVTKITMQ